MLSGHLCRCTGYEPIVDAIAEGGAVVNLARHSSAAAERHPEEEAVVDGMTRLSYAELLDRACRLAGGLAADGIAAGDRVAAVVKCRARVRRAVLGLPVARRDVRPALAPGLAGRPRLLPSRTRARKRGPRGGRRPRTAVRRRASRGARPGRAGGEPDALHVGNDRPAEGRPALAPCRSRGRPLASAPARLPRRRPDSRRHAALSHDGHALPDRDVARRRLLRLPARLERRGRRWP